MTQSELPTPLTAYVPKEYFYQADKSLDQARAEGRQYLDDVLDILNRIPDERLYEPVAAGRWSPAEYADHLARATWSWVGRLRECRAGEPMQEVGYGAMYPDGRAVMHAGTEPVPERTREDLRADLQAAHAALEEMLRLFEQEERLDEPCHPHQYFGTLSARKTAQLPIHHYARHLPVLQAQALPS